MTDEDIVRGPEVEEFFDRTAREYDSGYDDPAAGGRVLRSRAAAVIDLLGDKPGAVLDAGMGAGFLCEQLDRRGWEVSGVDIAPAMVEGAKTRLPRRRDHLVRGSITELPFAGGSFDAVVATGVLEYVVPELARAVGELARVLRPGGVAVVSFPNYRAPTVIWRGRVLYPLVRGVKRAIPMRRPAPPRMPRLALQRFRACLEAAGLDVEAVRPVGVRPVPASVAGRLEATGSSIALALATQVVVRARKPGT